MKRKEYNIDDRGEVNYVSTVVYILVVVIMIAVIMDVLAVIMTKQKMDSAADQITRQIQLAGKVDGDTDALVDFLSEGLGTPFYLTITADLHLGGFWQITGLPIQLTANCAGVSERYWK